MKRLFALALCVAALGFVVVPTSKAQGFSISFGNGGYCYPQSYGYGNYYGQGYGYRPGCYGSGYGYGGGYYNPYYSGYPQQVYYSTGNPYGYRRSYYRVRGNRYAYRDRRRHYRRDW
jgi:hypothetical protein